MLNIPQQYISLEFIQTTTWPEIFGKWREGEWNQGEISILGGNYKNK